MITVDAALQHTCAVFREQAERGDITATERDLLIDGAVLLAMHVEDLVQDGRLCPRPGWAEGDEPAPEALPGPIVAPIEVRLSA